MITDGQNGLASDFITQSEKNATPSNDAGRVPQLEADGRLSGFFTRLGQVVNAGATINGATLAVPVYQDKSDNEVYACDGNDTGKLKFLGFAVSNGTDGNPITVQMAGVVTGFSGLDEGEKYYLSDTAGTISNAPGTNEVLVGIAISTTDLLIMKGKRHASGVQTFSSTTTATITTGFRPSKVTIHAVLVLSEGDLSHSFGGWTVYGGNSGVYMHGTSNTNDGGGSATEGGGVAWKAVSGGGSDRHYGVVDTITDTTFRLNNTESGSPSDVAIYWTAEGEL